MCHDDTAYLEGRIALLVGSAKTSPGSAADELADFFERASLRDSGIENVVLGNAASVVVAQLLSESARAVRESFLNALVPGSSLACATGAYFDPAPIVEALDSFDDSELEYVPTVLGFFRDRQFLPNLEQHLDHPAALRRKAEIGARTDILFG